MCGASGREPARLAVGGDVCRCQLRPHLPPRSRLRTRSLGEPAVLPDTAGVLEARRVGNPPQLDSDTDAAWRARALRVRWRDEDTLEGHAAWEVELRCLYEDLRSPSCWLAGPGSRQAVAGTTFNRLGPWTIPALAGGPAPACSVACHTAYVDGQGGVAYMHSETIPQGSQGARCLRPATG